MWIAGISNCVRAIALGSVLVIGTVSAAEPNERAKKVIADRAKVTQEGFWIYGDFARACQEAKATGKPILAVLRCLPCVECVKLDDDVVDQDPVLKPLLEQFVCVRIVSTNGLDLSLFQFDTDQSFAAFILRDEKTIYGRFGTRSHRTDWLGDVSVKGLAAALRKALEIHAAWPRDQQALLAKRGPEPSINRPENFPSLRAKYAYQNKIDYEGDVVRSCIHCHQIGDAVRDELRANKQPISDELLFPYPHPKSIGLILNPDTSGAVRAVTPDTPAAIAGLKAGDEITHIDAQPILSMADVQWILHQLPATGGTLKVQYVRGDAPEQTQLKLEPGWRQQDDISWRVSVWGLTRMSLGGMRLEPLDAAGRAEQNIPAENMALRVRSVGQWGAHAAAKNAGFRVDDVILEIDGRKDLMSEADALRYGVQDKTSGRLNVAVLRAGRPMQLTLPLQE